MKEITRIHIAKTAYDIELAAKKALEKYMAALERYADDAELLSDIEIRITELLAERGVQAGGVITSDDVAAVRAQLGEPSDFLPEGSGDIAAGASGLEDGGKRLFRDLDSAILGGVLAGLARYFAINPLWIRLIFIGLLFVSFGAALIVYLLFWLVTPPARTAADKLRMVGQPVTLESIKRLGAESELVVNTSARAVRTILVIVAGILLVLMAVGALAAVGFGVAGLVVGSSAIPPANGWLLNSWQLNTAFGLFVLSGLLFAVLCSVLASAVFRRTWNKPIGIAVVAIIAAGLVVFITGVGMGVYDRFDRQVRIEAERRTTAVNLPAHFAAISSITVDADKNLGWSGQIEYIVAEKPRYELASLPGVKAQIAIAEDGKSATIKLAKTGNSTYQAWDYMAATTVLKVYGPALDTINANNSNQAFRYHNDKQQAKVSLSVHDGASVELSGSYDEVHLVTQADASVTLGAAVIAKLVVSAKGGDITAGVVRELQVQQPDACAANTYGDQENTVRVQAVSSGRMIYNGTEQAAKSVATSCGSIVIGEEG